MMKWTWLLWVQRMVAIRTARAFQARRPFSWLATKRGYWMEVV